MRKDSAQKVLTCVKNSGRHTHFADTGNQSVRCVHKGIGTAPHDSNKPAFDPEGPVLEIKNKERVCNMAYPNGGLEGT